jgi:hypothetical protein
MADEQQTKGITLTIPSVADFIRSAWGKTIAILAAVSILMGIILEAQSLLTGFQVLRKTSYEADIAQVNAAYARAIGKYP